MSVKQLSVFLENQPGALASATKILFDAGINIRALTIADTKDFGILRLITDDQEKAAAALSSAGLIIKQTDVLTAIIPDDPGSFAKVLTALADADISIEYTYAFLSDKTENGAAVVLRVDNNEKAEAALSSAGIPIGDNSLFH